MTLPTTKIIYITGVPFVVPIQPVPSPDRIYDYTLPARDYDTERERRFGWVNHPDNRSIR